MKITDLYETVLDKVIVNIPSERVYLLTSMLY